MSSARRSSGDVSDLEAHLGFWLRFVSNHVSGSFRKRVEEEGVTVSEWVALRALFASDAVSARALVESLGMTKGAVSKVLDRLEAKKLARRTADPDDARAQRIVLTAAGRRLVPRLAAIADENDARFFGHLAVAEKTEMTRMLRELVRVHRLTEVPTE